MQPTQIFPPSPLPASGELFEDLLTRPGVRIERIISAAHSRSGPYQQDWDEWVMVLQGNARLDVAAEQITLQTGQALLLPAGCRHSVLDTSAEPLCVWLAIHFKAPN